MHQIGDIEDNSKIIFSYYLLYETVLMMGHKIFFMEKYG